MKQLEKYSCVDYVNARGLVGAILFHEKEVSDRVVIGMVQQGILPVHTWSRSIKIGPPLTIAPDALEETFDVIEKIILDIGG